MKKSIFTHYNSTITKLTAAVCMSFLGVSGTANAQEIDHETNMPTVELRHTKTAISFNRFVADLPRMSISQQYQLFRALVTTLPASVLTAELQPHVRSFYNTVTNAPCEPGSENCIEIDGPGLHSNGDEANEVGLTTVQSSVGIANFAYYIKALSQLPLAQQAQLYRKIISYLPANMLSVELQPHMRDFNKFQNSETGLPCEEGEAGCVLVSGGD